MAAITRSGSTAAPTSETEAQPIYLSDAIFSKTPSADALYTGTVAVPREPALQPTADVLAASIESAEIRAAEQRAERFGVGDAAVPYLLESFRETGRFPDLSALSPEQRDSLSGTTTAGGPVLAGLFGGGSMGWLLLLGGFAVLALAFGTPGRPRRRRR